MVSEVLFVLPKYLDIIFLYGKTHLMQFIEFI